ncbi:GNAT family N-acetyltransferase [Comamonas testosteroni]|uniref:GNAT family N-acetyltransferase n=1 Tax=Comamonas testosteroni TaxID=285 RepID=UPI003465111B
MNQISIRPMGIGDYDSVTAMMKKTDGVTCRDAGSREATQRYLLSNPDLSFVALEGDHIVGCIMSGHNGRRGYLQHLVVLPTHRKRGIASRLVEGCLEGLERLGIHKSHIDVLQENHSAHGYWEGRGWKLRTDIRRNSFVRSGSDNT